ncbi:MAG: hypothetical protein GEV08_08890 [Acidimicrobiia bacterium]|nr:hypothetical protein [Acidimicrobiia bacterium]
MTRSRWPRTLVAALAVAAAGLAGLAGCSDDGDGEGGAGDDEAAPSTTVPFEWSGTAATVNGTAIPAQVIADQIEAFRQSPDAVQAALGDVPDLFQPGTEHPQPIVVADLLQTEIMVQLIQAELVTRGIAPSEDDLRIATGNVRAAFGASLEGLPEAFVEQLGQRYAQYIALDVALNPAPPEEELQAAYVGEPQKWERSCARHVLVTSEEDARSVLDQLRSGADFAEVARTRSQDTGSAPNGGDLGCLARGETSGAFEEALWSGPVGELQGPVTSEVGIHVLQVSSRGVPPYEEARESILLDKRAEPFANLGAWVTVRSVRSEITVDPRFGTWDATVGQVKPVGGTPEGLDLTPGPGGAGSSPEPSAPAGTAPGTSAPTSTAPATTPTTAGVVGPSTTR